LGARFLYLLTCGCENARKMNTVGCSLPTVFIFRNPLCPRLKAWDNSVSI
jgi:hypothetical protein